MRFARGLLYLQASIWTLICVATIVLGVGDYLPRVYPRNLAITIGTAGATAGFAAAKVWLGRRIAHQHGATRHGATRPVVMAVEWTMAGFGALLAYLTASLDGGTLPFLASLIGGSLSLAAAISLTRPPARRYFAKPGSAVTPPNSPGRASDHRGAQFWQPCLAIPAD